MRPSLWAAVQFAGFSRSLFLGAGILISPCIQTRETALPYRDNEPGFAIQATVGDSGASLLLESAVTQSVFSKAPERGETRDLRVAGIDLGPVHFLHGVATKADGAVGMSVLQHLAVGIDLYARKLTLWLPGRLSQSTVVTWMNTPGLGDRFGKTSVTSLPISIGPSGIPTSALRIGPLAANAAWAINGAGLEIPGSSHVQKACLTGPVHVGADTIPWAWCPASQAFEVGSLGKDIQGTIAPMNLASPKVLFDFAALKVYYQLLPPEGRASMILNMFVQAPLLITPSDIVLGGAGIAGSDVESYTGDKVLSIAGVSASDVRGALLTPTADSESLLNKLVDLCRNPHDVTISLADGSEGVIKAKGWE